MKYINNALTRLEFFTLSPLFPLLLSLTIFIACKVFDPVINLCDDDGWTLFQLKSDLSNEITKLNSSISNKQLYYNSYQELMGMRISNPNWRNFNAEQSLLDNIERSRSDMYESLDRIRELERYIRRIDSNYISLYSRPIRFGKYLPK